jgi:hypothetical protein
MQGNHLLAWITEVKRWREIANCFWLSICFLFLRLSLILLLDYYLNKTIFGEILLYLAVLCPLFCLHRVVLGINVSSIILFRLLIISSSLLAQLLTSVLAVTVCATTISTCSMFGLCTLWRHWSSDAFSSACECCGSIFQF